MKSEIQPSITSFNHLLVTHMICYANFRSLFKFNLQNKPKKLVNRCDTCVSASFCCCPSSQHFKYTWELSRTCDQLILISPYYITMKSTCFNY